jgi:predicted ribonuclease YlaK
MGVSLLTAGKVGRIVLSRPAVEAGERLGFLPGDMKEKSIPICAHCTTRCTICCRPSRSPIAWIG